jgi:hypothetical protein
MRVQERGYSGPSVRDAGSRAVDDGAGNADQERGHVGGGDEHPKHADQALAELISESLR